LIDFTDGLDGSDWSDFTCKPNAFSQQANFLKANAKAWQIANERYDAIKPIIGSTENGIQSNVEAYIRGYLSTEYIQEIADSAPTQHSKRNSKSVKVTAKVKKSGVSLQSIYNWLNMFLAYGSSRPCLLSNYSVCGSNRELPENAEIAMKILTERGGNFVGRKTSFRARKVKFRRDINQQDIERLQDFLKKELRNCKDFRMTAIHAGFTVSKSYDETNLFDSGGSVSYLNPSKYMSYDQFRYHFNRKVNHEFFTELKKSVKQAYNDNSRKRGIAQQQSVGPSDVYEIDSTTLNMYVVSRIHSDTLKVSTRVLGRPYLYFVVDVYSGMIVGYCITFSRNSMAAKRALFNAFTNKVKHCQRYGIQISEEDWPCNQVCIRLLCDRGGEYFKGLFTDALQEDLGWEGITYTPAYLSRGKGTVEVNFNAADGFIIQRLPGRVKPNPAKDAVHPSNFARVTIDELNRLVIQSVLSFNRTRINFNRLNSFDVQNGLEPTPINIWNEYIGQKMGGGIVKSPELVRYAMLHAGKAKITRNYIELITDKYTLKYRTTDSEFESLQQKLKDEKASFELAVRYNPDDPRYIWSAVNDLSGRIVQFEIAAEDRRFDSLHEKEIEDQKEIESAIRSVSRQTRNFESVDIDHKISEEIRKSRELNSRKPSRKGMVKGIDENFKDAALTETVMETRLTQELFSTFFVASTKETPHE
jgi:hypothetical protein